MHYSGRLHEFDGPKINPSDPEKIAKRLYALSYENEHGCWIFTGTSDRAGYGRFWFPEGAKRAHRVSYELSFGDIPKDHFVCHKCDIPSCINPSHLFIGTHKDNHADCVSKKRHQYGESHWRCQLTEKDVHYIRTSEKTTMELARELGVKYHTAWQARKRKTWKHI